MRCRHLPLSRTRGWRRLAITPPKNSKNLTSNWLRTSYCSRNGPRRREHTKGNASWEETVLSPRFSTLAIAPNDLGDARGASQRSVAFDWNLSDFLRRSCKRRERFWIGGSWETSQCRIPLVCIHHPCRSSRTCLRASFSIYQNFAISDPQGICVSRVLSIPPYADTHPYWPPFAISASRPSLLLSSFGSPGTAKETGGSISLENSEHEAFSES